MAVKKLLVIGCVWVQSSAFVVGLAQGVVIFANYLTGSPVDAPVFYLDCRTPLAGPAYLAQLYAGRPGTLVSELVPVGLPSPFMTGRGAGYWRYEFVEIPFIPAGAYAGVQVRAWEAKTGSYEAAQSGQGLYGMSAPLTLQLGSSFIGLPPNLRGLQSFCLVPEPPVVLLLPIGGILLLFAQCKRRRGRGPEPGVGFAGLKPGGFKAISRWLSERQRAIPPDTQRKTNPHPGGVPANRTAATPGGGRDRLFDVPGVSRRSTPG